jgi:hypothetical protein
MSLSAPASPSPPAPGSTLPRCWNRLIVLYTVLRAPVGIGCADEGGRMFFFEKKNQKTFIYLGTRCFGRVGVGGFLLF